MPFSFFKKAAPAPRSASPAPSTHFHGYVNDNFFPFFKIEIEKNELRAFPHLPPNQTKKIPNWKSLEMTSSKFFATQHQYAANFEKIWQPHAHSIILLLLDSNYIHHGKPHFRYAYIGAGIYEFVTLSEIVEFRSPVGNNETQYPVAIAENGTVYLLWDQTAMQLHPDHKLFLEKSKTVRELKIGRDVFRSNDPDIFTGLYLAVYTNSRNEEYSSRVRGMDIVLSVE